jgi:hypothetical protein
MKTIRVIKVRKTAAETRKAMREGNAVTEHAVNLETKLTEQLVKDINSGMFINEILDKYGLTIVQLSQFMQDLREMGLGRIPPAVCKE